jgi:hypothetical protein
MLMTHMLMNGHVKVYEVRCVLRSLLLLEQSTGCMRGYP